MSKSPLKLPKSQMAKPIMVDGFPLQIIDRCLQQSLIFGKYQILDFLDKGSYGQVVTVKDISGDSDGTPSTSSAASGSLSGEQLIMKVITSTTVFLEEVAAMKRIYRRAAAAEERWGQAECPVPRVVDCGLLFQLKQQSPDESDLDLMFQEYLIDEKEQLSIKILKSFGKVNAFIIMPRYGQNLAELFVRAKYDFSLPTVLDIGRRIVEQLRAVHKAGYVYNDLKPDNVMLEYDSQPVSSDPDTSCLSGLNLHLIDFGFCSEFRDRKSGQPFTQHTLKKFRGNLRYASVDQLTFLATARKDDLISLCYMLVYFLKQGKFLGDPLQERKTQSSVEKMQWTREQKIKMTPASLCTGRAKPLLPFVEEVFRLRFFDKPSYSALIRLLDDLPSTPNQFQALRREAYLLALRNSSPQPKTTTNWHSSFQFAAHSSLQRSFLGAATPSKSPTTPHRDKSETRQKKIPPWVSPNKNGNLKRNTLMSSP